MTQAVIRSTRKAPTKGPAPKQEEPASSGAPKTAAEQEEEEAKYKPLDFALVRRMLGLLAPYKGQYAVGLALGLAMTAIELQSPKFMEAMINHVIAYGGGPDAQRVQPSYVGRFVYWVTGLTPWGSSGSRENAAIAAVVLIVLFWGLTLLTAVILQRFTILTMTGAGERVQFGLRRRMFEKLQQLSMSYYDKTKLGRIISRCTSDIGSLREINVWGLYQIAANFLMMVIAAAMLVTTDWRLFLSVAPLGILLLIINRVYFIKSKGLFQASREGWTRVSTNLAENITGMRVVAAFNRQVPNLSTFNQLQEANTANNVTVSRATGIYNPTLQLIGFIGKVIILSYGAYLVVRGSVPGARPISVGNVVAAFMYWDWFMAPILSFGVFYNQLMMAMAGGERVFNLLDTPPDVQDVPGAEALPRINGRVEFDHVTFGYNPDRPVLHEVSFVAQPGRTVALVGATGSGKSSIISLIARFYQPQQGKVLVDGHDVRYVTGESLHRQMGLVLQVNYLFTGTVMENIRYSKYGATREDVIAAARAIGSYDAIMTLKDGFDTEVGERGANMSLGQRQLICFTRAFLADPRIFMLDEATSAVDTATELLVQQSLERLLAGRTTFIVAHRLSTIMKADTILVIEQGRILERGTHAELLEQGGKYAALYEQFIHHSE